MKNEFPKPSFKNYIHMLRSDPVANGKLSPKIDIMRDKLLAECDGKESVFSAKFDASLKNLS